MTRFVDVTGKVADITMNTWTGNGYTPDFSADFFEVGGLHYIEELDAHEVEDVDYCIEQANDWKDGTGDYYTDENTDDRNVDVDTSRIEGKWYKNLATGVWFSEDEVRCAFEDFRFEMGYNDFDEWLGKMLELGRGGDSGLVEI